MQCIVCAKTHCLLSTLTISGMLIFSLELTLFQIMLRESIDTLTLLLQAAILQLRTST